MATTATTTPNRPVTYSLLDIYTVDPRTHERLQAQHDIRTDLNRPKRRCSIGCKIRVPCPAGKDNHFVFL